MGLHMTEEEYAAYLARRNKGMTQEQARQSLHTGRGPRPPFYLPTPPAEETQAEPKRAKYGNRRVEIDGIKFDSQKEANYYQRLKMLQKAGELRLVLLQVPFILPGNIKYYADFLTIDKSGNFEVIDVKSDATKKNRTYINKKKQVKAVYGIEIVEV